MFRTPGGTVRAWLTKEGSVRKNTAVCDSDLDLMVHLSREQKMTRDERETLKTQLEQLSGVFERVTLGPNAVREKVVQC